MKTLLPLLAIFTFAKIGFSQQQAGTNLYEFMENYYLENPYPIEDDTTNRGGFAKSYDRAFIIWAPRLYPHGNFQFAANAMYDYNQDYLLNGPDESSYAEVNWTPLGPIGVGSTEEKGVGHIHRITFDPQYNGTSNKTVYGASSFSGLWRSEDDGDSWNHVNTDLQLPIASVSDIAIDYMNSNNLFICTGWGMGELILSQIPIGDS